MTLCEKHTMTKGSLLQSKPVIYANYCRRRDLCPSLLTSQLRASHRGSRGREASVLRRSRCLLQQPGWKRGELDRIKTSSVGFCHQWLLQYQSLCTSLWPPPPLFIYFLFSLLPRFSLSLPLSLTVSLCVSLSSWSVASVFALALVGYVDTFHVFCFPLSHRKHLWTCVFDCWNSFHERAEGKSGCVYLWEDLERWHGGRLGLVQP